MWFGAEKPRLCRSIRPAVSNSAKAFLTVMGLRSMVLAILHFPFVQILPGSERVSADDKMKENAEEKM